MNSARLRHPRHRAPPLAARAIRRQTDRRAASHRVNTRRRRGPTTEACAGRRSPQPGSPVSERFKSGTSRTGLPGVHTGDGGSFRKSASRYARRDNLCARSARPQHQTYRERAAVDTAHPLSPAGFGRITRSRTSAKRMPRNDNPMAGDIRAGRGFRVLREGQQ